MSRIDKLIAKLCPDGVEFKELGEVGNLFIGSFVKKTEQNDNYEWPVYNGGISPTGYYNNFNSNKNSVVLSARGANCGFVNYLTVDFWAGNSCYVIKDLSYDVNSKFLFHYLKCNEINLYGLRQTSGIPAINSAPLKKFKIPIPPLPIQQEIVRILDTFTDLDAELQAELEARKKQYEHYRNQLLNFEGKEVEWKTLGEVCEMKSGKSISSYDISNFKIEGNIYPCFGGNGLRGYVKSYSHYGNFPIIGRQGALCGNVCYAEGGFYATEHAVVVTNKGQFSPRFLYYYLTIMNLNQYATNGAQPGLSVSKLKKLQIPIPPLSEQEQIVSILNKFEALLNKDLPAEIAARCKQYEYYREKLLAFEPLVS